MNRKGPGSLADKMFEVSAHLTVAVTALPLSGLLRACFVCLFVSSLDRLYIFTSQSLPSILSIPHSPSSAWRN